MIIMDYSNISIMAYMYAAKNFSNPVRMEDLRPTIIKSILGYKKQFRDSGYGTSIVLAVDSGQNWRKDYFEHYKASRSKSREADTNIDWADLFTKNREMLIEIATKLPIRVIKVAKTEGDDIIGVLAKYYHQSEKIGIVSSDKDFKQLLKYPNVKIWSTFTKEFMNEPDPSRFLFEHIIKGDGGDGVPNIKSPGNAFVDKIRQKSIFAKELDIWVNDPSLSFLTTPEMREAYTRNSTLINLDKIPQEYVDEILRSYEEYQTNPRNVYKYFASTRLVNFMDDVQEFSW
jgi:hypothetical protein